MTPYAWQVDDDLPSIIDCSVFLNPTTLGFPDLFEKCGIRCLVFYDVVYKVVCGNAKLNAVEESLCFVDVDDTVACTSGQVDCTQGCGPMPFSMHVLPSNMNTSPCTDAAFA